MIVFCCYCGKRLDDKSIITKEHIIPVSKRGNNSHFNILKCCKKCNVWRGNKNFKTWKTEVAYYLSKHKKREGYSEYDLSIILENIEYVQEYVSSNKDKLFKKLSRIAAADT